MVAKRRGNREGSFSQDSRGRWVGRSYVPSPAGVPHRIAVYGKTREEAKVKLQKRLALDVPGHGRDSRQPWTVGDYLDYWLDSVVRRTTKPRTVEFYESAIRLHLKPTIGRLELQKLGVQDVQRAFNGALHN